jgi:hypothetical protein
MGVGEGDRDRERKIMRERGRLKNQARMMGGG